ncbi:endonuclease NucS domain-containing protein [Rhizobium leguminosarum]|uniref:endonuclease NucS domain-containing protein n=1 Tax=Rhizobium leguminosarum TaxID=384 RepID=UPI001441F124|nr:endonuclease NucS domain-containing protein [Rhizobium leguminosarum]MBY5867833.1 DUF91 domain-containing protein [Rhizobium leguminosarum]NKM06470.1 DUF91 domain-containing protein [Rhizobium leguminosarum bv. viciae]
MSEQPLPTADKPILGLFANEAELRDHLAGELHLVEPGLTLLDTEYVLKNPNGSGGRIDILARDSFGHILCIEIKRSDNSARSTLNELSKYVSLLVEREKVLRELIRCVVVSTHWGELLLPLSYFARSAGVHVTALKAARDGDVVVLESIPLIELQFLPMLSPDMDLIWFDEQGPRLRYVDLVKSRALNLPFVRLALLLFDPRSPATEHACYPMMICIWRVGDGFHEAIEQLIGKPIGEDWPYVRPGWELEADAKNWIADVTTRELPEVARGWTHGTPEKLSALLPNYNLANVERVGDWPRIEIINDDAQILAGALAASPLGGAERLSRHSFRATVTPAIAPSWQKAVDAFLAFISFEPAWQEQAKAYIDRIASSELSVELHAYDKKHLVYAIHQARFHSDTMVSYFEIVVSSGGKIVQGIRGDYAWDGQTCPRSAEGLVNEVYGGIMHARLAIQSAVDDARYDQAYAMHGFVPRFAWIGADDPSDRTATSSHHSIADFVGANARYCAAISATLEKVGALPTDPSS